MEDTIQLVFQVIWLVVVIVELAAYWTIFNKAGQPGWAILVPIYNLYIMLKIADKPGWWILLLFIPIVNIAVALVITVMVSVGIATNFGKGIGFAIGLILLPIVFVPILAFGDAQYLSVPGAPGTDTTPDNAQFTPINPTTAQSWRS